jgi:hypothetical protein
MFSQKEESLQCMMNVFEYSIFIAFIPNQTTYFLNILETLSYKQIENLQH